MAEFVCRHILAREGVDDVQVESAALHNDEIGNDTDSRTLRILRREGIPFSPRRAWRLTRAKALDYDLIVGMDGENMRDLRNILSEDDLPRVCTMLSFLGRPGESVADPWYTGDFELTYRQIAAACEALVRQLRAKL